MKKTNDELKKKITEIVTGIKGHTFLQAEQIADALIAAGIGDMREAEHRAEVAERALEERATYCAMKDLDYFSLTTVAVESRVKEFYDEWVKQAEKELVEEDNND